MSNDSFTNTLKVKADPPDISHEDRKKMVRKLAGAVAHSLRHNGEVGVRCFGNACIGKGSKAIAIAREFMIEHGLALYFAPAFIEAEMDDQIKTGMSFCVFTEDLSENGLPDDLPELRVKSDPHDSTDSQRKDSVRSLAGAIAHSLRSNGRVDVRCFGNASIGKAVKSLAVARGLVAVHGLDLYCTSHFITANINGDEKTGIGFYAFTGGNE